jgi:hypothetical protein
MIANSYQTKNVLITMGDDFAYKKANETFEFAESIAKSLKSD